MTLKEAQPSAPPQTPEPLKGKYSACRICGRGASSKAAHRTIATHGVHTDALHQPNRPNNGTAYCDQCEDETLVILSAPLAPAVEPEPPKTETIEVARQRVDVAAEAFWPCADDAPNYGQLECGWDAAIDALIAAVRAESSPAPGAVETPPHDDGGPEGCICPRDGGVCWSCGGTPCTPPKEENRNE